MKELKVGEKFNNFGDWFDEVIEIIHQKGNVALIKYKNNFGNILYSYMQKIDGDWHSFVSGPSLIRGLLYPYFDEVEYDNKDNREL